ncbi:C-terminal binding protein [Roseovarius sp. 2305UL8-3]|uniref:C-terminal binding protein n=1 Tax=Roseovarius conchicola TaxID=3121636 RepID=UPI003528D482
MKLVFVDYNDPSVLTQIEPLAQAGVSAILADLKNPTEDEVIEVCKSADILVSSRVPLSRRILASLPEVKMLCAPQVGFDHFDVTAARDLDLRIGHSAFCNYTEVASHALALALILVRQIPIMQRHTATGGWDFTTAGALQRPGTMTVGIIGLGRIGGAFAMRAVPCFKRLIAYDPFRPAEDWPQNVERAEHLSDLLSHSDIVSLHTPLTDLTRGLVDAAFLSAMPQGSFLLNTARGEIADPAAILDALESGHLAGAGLDVLPQEPPHPDDPVLTHPRIVVTPHSAFYSEQSRQDKYAMVTENVLSFIKTGAPKYDALGL